MSAYFSLSEEELAAVAASRAWTSGPEREEGTWRGRWRSAASATSAQATRPNSRRGLRTARSVTTDAGASAERRGPAAPAGAPAARPDGLGAAGAGARAAAELEVARRLQPVLTGSGRELPAALDRLLVVAAGQASAPVKQLGQDPHARARGRADRQARAAARARR